jgi:hypothetical protein
MDQGQNDTPIDLLDFKQFRSPSKRHRLSQRGLVRRSGHIYKSCE